MWSCTIDDKPYKINEITYWLFSIVTPFSFALASFLVMTFIFIKDCRKTPGSLLLMISISDMLFAIHWFSTALFSDYGLLSGKVTIGNDSMFC